MTSLRRCPECGRETEHDGLRCLECHPMPPEPPGIPNGTLPLFGDEPAPVGRVLEMPNVDAKRVALLIMPRGLPWRPVMRRAA